MDILAGFIFVEMTNEDDSAASILATLESIVNIALIFETLPMCVPDGRKDWNGSMMKSCAFVSDMIAVTSSSFKVI